MATTIKIKANWETQQAKPEIMLETLWMVKFTPGELFNVEDIVGSAQTFPAKIKNKTGSTTLDNFFILLSILFID